MLSERARALKPSPTLALNARAQELAKAGRDIVALVAGEPDWDTFENIKVAARKALDEGFTKYTPSAGIPDLRAAVVERVKADLGLTYEASQCMIGLGAKQVVFNIMQVLLNAGDEVIIPAPYWVSYPAMVQLADGKPVIATCPRETGFKLTPDILKRSLTAKTKVLILNSPNNPTGAFYSEAELKDLAAVLERTGVWVVSDDIYDKMVLDGVTKIAPHIAQVSEKLRPQVLLVNSLSKTYSMTGWRIGSLVGDKRIVDACSNYQSQSASCAVSFAQKAAVEALRGSQKTVEDAMKELRRRRDVAMKALSEFPELKMDPPAGAFFLWVPIEKSYGKVITVNGESRTISNSADFATALLDVEGVATVPGAEFGMDGYIRLSYTVAEKKLLEGIKRLGRFIQS